MTRRFGTLLACGAALLAIGCGGSGGGGGTTDGGSGGSAGRVGIFVTDDLRTGYDRVWVSIKRVELTLAAGPARIVFNRPEGVTVDLVSLRDASGERFRFLGEASVPRGTYTGVRVVLDKDLQLFATGSTAGAAREFAGVAAGAEDAALQLSFATPKTLGDGNEDLVIDFDLAQWTDDGSKVTAVIKEGATNALTLGDRHGDDEHKGVVSALNGNAPSLTFTLRVSDTATITVETSAATEIVSEGGTPSPAVANGQRVEVEGVFDFNTRRLQASKVKLEDDDEEDEDEVEGVASSVNATEGAFVVTPDEVEGFLPASATVNVRVAASTRFFADSGFGLTREQFFTQLAAAGEVEAEGTYDASTNTLTAVKVKIEDEDDDGDEDEDPAEIRGAASTVNQGDQSFVVAVSAFEGLFTQVGAPVTVATTNATQFRGDDGQTLTAAQFYAQVGTAQAVEVEGVFQSNLNRLLATKVKLEDDAANDDVEVEGLASAVNAGTRSLTLTVASWENGFFFSGQQITVTAIPSAAFENDDGQTMTAEQFFAAIAGGARVDVRGSFFGGTLQADRLRIDLED